MAATTLPEWQGFFSFVGLVAGGLTGLIFVALSIQIGAARGGRQYVVRARTTLNNLTGILILSGLALVPGQGPAAFAIEAAIVLAVLVWDILRTVRQFERPGEPLPQAVRIRTGLALSTLFLGLVGCVALLAGVGDGLVLIGAAALLGLPVRILQAWALLDATLQPALADVPAVPRSEDAAASGPDTTG